MTEVFSLSELAQTWSDENPEDPISPRTLRYYISQGLFEGPGRVGPGKHYRKYHLDKIKAIRLLQENGNTIEEIRRLFNDLSPDKISSIVQEQQRILNMRAEADLKLRGLSQSGSTEQNNEGFASRTRHTSMKLLGIDSLFNHRGMHYQPRISKSNWIKVQISTELEVLVQEPFAKQHEKDLQKWLEDGALILNKPNSKGKSAQAAEEN